MFAGGEEPETVEKRNKWRKQIKVNSIEAAASGKELEGQLLYYFGFFLPVNLIFQLSVTSIELNSCLQLTVLIVWTSLQIKIT